jgi:phospholipid/cholesterol/gamma-HCH transport system substrate-binding protein
MSRTVHLGMFIVSTLAVLAAGIFLVGRNQLMFNRTYRLQADFGTVSGLNGGAEVRVGGLRKGVVKAIRLPNQPDEKVAVEMNLDRSTREVVKKDSVASIQTEGLMGSKYVDISFGSKDAPQVDDGDTIDSVPPLDISDLFKKTNDILDSSKTAMNNMGQLTDNLKSVSAKIDQGKGTMGALVNDRKMYDQLNATAAQAKDGATAFQENMEALKHNFFLRGFYKKRGYADSAQLTKNEAQNMPQGPYLKKFSYGALKIFNKPDAAKLKNEKSLDEPGRFLEQNKFGSAVIVAYTGMKGDSDKDLELSEARAMVVRNYLVNNFKFDDTRLKTMGMGKNGQPEDSDAGGIEIVIYPAGGEAPGVKRMARAGR